MKHKNIYKHLIRTGIVLISVGILAATTLLFLTYVMPTQSPLVRAFAGALPAVIVEGDVISMSAISANTKATRSFYENQNLAENGIRVDFDTEDGEKRLKLIEKEVINNLLEAMVIKDLVKASGESVTTDHVAMALDRTLKKGDVDQAKERVALYGWSLDDFAQKVIRPSLYQERLEKIYNEQNAATQEMKDKMELAQQMIRDGRSFAEAAETHSEGIAAQDGGAQGVFYKEQLDPIIADIAFALPLGEVSETFESPLGLHILMVDDIVASSDAIPSPTQISLNHIFVAKKTFARYLDEEITARSVKIFLPEYKWDADQNLVIFHDKDLQAYEQKAFEEMLEVIEEQAQVVTSKQSQQESVTEEVSQEGGVEVSPAQ